MSEIDDLRRQVAGLEAELAAVRAGAPDGDRRQPHYEAIFSSAVDFAILATDVGGTITDWNSGAEHLFGWSAEAAIGSSAECLFTPDDRARGAAHHEMRTALADGRVSDERWHMRNDGTQFWAVGEMMPLRGTGGDHLGFLKIVWDRTQQRRDATAFREAQTLNALILDSSRDCIVVLDLNARTLFVSSGGIAAMEIEDADAILGLSWLRAWSGEDFLAAKQAVAEARAGRIGRFRGFCPTHKGRMKWWDIAISPLLGSDGQPERLVSVGRDITNLKQVEAKLATADERLRLALGAAALVGTWDWDITADRVFADANFARIYAVDPARAAAGVPIAEFTRNFHPDDVAGYEAALNRAISGDAEFSCEYRINQPDGTVCWLLARGRVIRDATGVPSRFPGASVDITERKAAEARQAAILSLGDRLRDLDDAAEMAFVAAELLGCTLGVSRAGYGTVDPAAETVTIDRDWTAAGIKHLTGTFAFRDFGSYIEDIKGGEVVSFGDCDTDPRTAATADALKAIDARALVNMPITEHGMLVAIFFINNATTRSWAPAELDFIRDVADRTRVAVERRRAERQLEDLAASLEQQVAMQTAERNRLWETTNDLMATAGLDGYLKAVNPAWTRKLGWSEAELLSLPFLELIDPADHAETQKVVERLAAGETITAFIDHVYTKGGEALTIMWTADPAWDVFYIVGRDITEQRRVEDALRQSQKMEAVGQLTGGLAHDFNNLLTGVTGSLDLLALRLTQGRLKDLDRYINAAQGAAKRAAALTHRLLAFSRRQTLDPKPTDVNRLVAGMEDLIRRTIGPAIHLEVVGTAALWPVMVDPNQLENALLNLCINARDAMPDGGRLTIETANKWLDERAARDRELPPGQYLSLCVTDTGTGMTPDVIKRAFDPFFTTKPIGEGTGLGLSMIYGFARQSDGQVRIYSEIGQGTTMCLYLPRHLGEAEREAEHGVRPGSWRADQGETVLVVDDEPTVRMLVTEVLEDLGYIAIEAADGASGLKVLQSDVRIDLLVTDVGLPGGMNGRQLADAGRVDRPDLKVLFITGYAENAVIGNGRLAPGMRVLTKPFAMDALASQIKDMVGQP